MTAVINPTPEKNITDFHARALKANYMIQPGGSWPSEAESNAESQLFAPPLTTVQVTVTQASTSAPTSAANQQSPNSTRHLSTVEIAGTAIGAAAVLGLIGGLSYYLARRKATDPEIREKPPVPGAIDHGPFIPPPTPGYMSPQQVYHDSFADRGSYAYNYAPDPRSFPAGVIEEKPLPSQAWGNTVQPSAPVAGASDPVEIDSQTSYGTPGQYQPVSPAGPALSEFNGQDTPNRFSTMSPDSFKGKDH